MIHRTWKHCCAPCDNWLVISARSSRYKLCLWQRPRSHCVFRVWTWYRRSSLVWYFFELTISTRPFASGIPYLDKCVATSFSARLHHGECQRLNSQPVCFVKWNCAQCGRHFSVYQIMRTTIFYLGGWTAWWQHFPGALSCHCEQSGTHYFCLRLRKHALWFSQQRWPVVGVDNTIVLLFATF